MQNYLLAHRIAFLKNTTNYISAICIFFFQKCFLKKHAFGGGVKTQVLCYQVLAFLKYLKNKKFIHIRERPARRLDDAVYQLLTELV